MSVVVLISVLFGLGCYGVLTRRDLVGVLASIEVLVAAPLVLLVALSATVGGAARAASLGLIVLVLAAAEASVGLALVVAAARESGSTRVDGQREVNG